MPRALIPTLSRLSTRAAWGLTVGLLFVVALAVRLVGAKAVLAADRVHLIDPDSHLHAWRMDLALAHLPGLPPSHEPMLAHPHGVELGWPPGFDILGALLARALGATPGGDETISRAGTFLVVLLGAATALVVLGLARRLTSRLFGLLAGALLALWPLHVEYSRVGRIDYHVAAPLLVVLTALLYFRAARPRGAPGRWWPAAVAAGVALGSCLWLWTTAPLAVGLLGVGVLLHQALAGGPPVAPVMMASALALTAPLVLASPFRARWVLHGPSALHLWLVGSLVAGAVWIGVARWLGARRGPDARPQRRSVVLLGLGAIGGLALATLATTEGFGLALSFGTRSGLWRLILEQRPLTELPVSHILLLLTYLAPALPLLGALALRAPLRRGARHEVLLLTGWAGAYWALGVAQVRFLPVALALSAPLCGLGAAEAARRLRGALGRRARPALLRSIAPAIALGALCLMWPAADYLGDAVHLPGPRRLALEAAARHLRGRAAPLGPAVMAPLAAGHLVVNLGRSPTVGSALIDPTTLEATRDTLAFFLADDQGRARRIARGRQVGRVLVTTLPPRRHQQYLRYLDRPFHRAVVRYRHRHIMATRLSLDLGSGRPLESDYLPAIGWLRHEWDSAPARGGPPVRLFQVVPGAVLTGTIAPGDVVELTVPLATNRGRPFAFRSRQRADRRGRFRIRVPYWTRERCPPAVVRHHARMRQLRAALARGERDLAPRDPGRLPPLASCNSLG